MFTDWESCVLQHGSSVGAGVGVHEPHRGVGAQTSNAGQAWAMAGASDRAGDTDPDQY